MVQIKNKSFSIAALFSAAFFFASCADLFQERVAMQINENEVTLSALMTKSTVISELDPPKQIFVSDCENPDRIQISWSKVNGANSYHLERAVSNSRDAAGNWIRPDEGEYEPLDHSSFIEGTAFEDIIIDNTPSNVLDYQNPAYERAYFYRVYAENTILNCEPSRSIYSGNIIEKSEYEKDEPHANEYAVPVMLLTPPMNLRASGGTSTENIYLTWTRPEASVSSYRIYRSTNSDGSGGSQVATEYGNSRGSTIKISKDMQGKFFYFTVVSVSSSGKESVSSSVAMGYTLKEGAPGQVEEVQVSEGRGTNNGKISLTWKAVSGLGIKYRVYRYSSADSTLKELANGLEDTSYEDKSNLKPNLFYYYMIQAYTIKDELELVGQMSDSGDSSKNPAEGYLVSPPQSVIVQKITGNINQNKIIFSAAIGSAGCIFNSANTNKVGDYNTYTYVVKGAPSVSGPWNDVASFKNLNPPDTASGCYEETVNDWKFYKMWTEIGSEPSGKSAETSIVAPAPFAAKNCSVSKNAAIPGYTDVLDNAKPKFPKEPKANDNGVHAVKITWEAPDGGADGGYNVFRSTKPDSGYKKITDSPVTNLYYIYEDKQAKAGTYYYYRVLSLNSLGQGSNYSDPDYGYGALTVYQYMREYIKTTLNSQKKLTLMHKSGSTAKLGSETINGDISGTLSYNAKVSGLGGHVDMHYTNYADFYIMGDSSLGVYFLLDGDTDTDASMSQSGNMSGTVKVQGMYPGRVCYDGVQIKGGAAGGGNYGVWREGIDPGNDDSPTFVEADWTWGEK